MGLAKPFWVENGQSQTQPIIVKVSDAHSPHKFIIPFQVYFESPFWLKLENENSNITIFPKNYKRAPHNTF